MIGSCRDVGVTRFLRCLGLECFVALRNAVSLFRRQVPQVQTTGPKETLTPGVTGACCDRLWVAGALPQCVVCDMADTQDLSGRSRVYGWVCMTWGGGGGWTSVGEGFVRECFQVVSVRF